MHVTCVQHPEEKRLALASPDAPPKELWAAAGEAIAANGWAESCVAVVVMTRDARGTNMDVSVTVPAMWPATGVPTKSQ